MIRITVACPEALIDKANQLASCLGYSEADANTYGEVKYVDSLGNKYSMASGLVEEEFLENAFNELVEPSWGVNLVKAKEAQSLVRVFTPEDQGSEASPEAIVTIVCDDVSLALLVLGIRREEDLGDEYAIFSRRSPV